MATPTSPSTSSPRAAVSLLQRQLKEIKNSHEGFSAGLIRDDNMLEWKVVLMINEDCKYYGGGMFRAHLLFPPEYPLKPPKMVFQHPVPFHPNIYRNGELCISILHPPEDDKYGYESAAERWNPVQTPETILLSVISLFNDPNEDSPANVDAANLLRDLKEGKSKEFRRRVRACVDASQELFGYD